MSSKPRFKSSPQIFRYGAAVVSVALATAIRLPLSNALGTRLPFTTYFIAVILVAIYGGLGPALISVALGAVLGTYLFVPPVLQVTAFCILTTGLSVLIKVIQDARRRAEQSALALAESRERLATILASIGDAVIATDLEGRVTFMNGVAQSLTLWNEEDASGKPIQELFRIVGEESREPECPVARVLREGVAVRSASPVLLISRDGTEIPVEDNSSSIKNESGRTTGVVLVFRDITQRKLVEQALREKEERFRTMADTTPVMLWLSGADGLCNFFNQSWLDFTGRTMEQEIGYGWADNVHPDELRRCLDTYVSSLETRKGFTIEYRLRRSDGVYRWVLDSGVPRYTKGGEFIGFAGSCIDIADRKQAEEAAHSLASIVKSSEDAIIGKRLDGTIVSWNASAERIYGYAADEVKGKDISILSPDDRRDELAKIFESLKR
ncbi:MAG TPA: PAS domain S-box protein, partial [Blastocatellia bacterium]|nr:PAS domain S-box protein [Blastocatellia bacterium]